MTVEIRAVADDEFPQMLEVDRRAFGMGPRPESQPDTWVRAHTDRTRCAFDDGALVACSRAYPFEMTMPGGAPVPIAAVSAVAVQPSHRRRGILTQMMDALRRDATERGELALGLTASESVIYGRFGYGIATWRLGCVIERAHVRFRRPLEDDGRVRIVDADESAKTFPEVYERARVMRAGMVSRPDYWWPEITWSEPSQVIFDVVHEDARGRADGFTHYELTGSWGYGISERRLVVHDLQSTTPLAREALWHYLLGVDLVAEVTVLNVPVDDPVRFLLADPRRLRTRFVNDQLWVMPIDIAGLLAARVYAAPGSLVLDVDGERIALDAGADGAAAAPTKRSADLTCSRATFGALVLGGNTWSTLAAAGLVDEHTAGALARADVLFSTIPAPATLTGF